MKKGTIHVNEPYIKQKYTPFDAYPKELFTFLHNIFATNCLQYDENNYLLNIPICKRICLQYFELQHLNTCYGNFFKLMIGNWNF